MTRRTLRSAILALALLAPSLASTGCASTNRAPERPARIGHIVFLKLVKPADTPALIADCDADLARIPGVIAYSSGRHIDTGRPTVIADYDVGLYIGFQSEQDYEHYVTDPLHTNLVERWRPRLQWIRVYDVLDEAP